LFLRRLRVNPYGQQHKNIENKAFKQELIMESTWEFDTTVGAGSVIVTVVYEYESDEDSTYNESIKEVWFEGRNIIGVFSDEQFKEMECEAAMRFQSHKLNYKTEDV
jgi:hypothetical protein